MKVDFITKAEARELGWNPRDGNLTDVAPGKSIGGGTYLEIERVYCLKLTVEYGGKQILIILQGVEVVSEFYIQMMD